MKKRLLVLGLCAIMLVSGFSGCSNKGVKDTTVTEQTEGAKEATTSEVEATVLPEDYKETGLSSIFPLKEKVTLTYYIRANGAMSATMETYEDVEFFKELEKQTNVHIEWNHNATNESFALMLASGQLPDMINWNIGSAAGGAQALLEDDIILDLTELMPKYTPNYYAWLQANPEEDKAYKLDDGTQYQFVNFNGNWENRDIVYYSILGPQIRQDWLDKVGLKMPTTTDELYKVLTAFKKEDVNGNGDPNDEIPYVIVGSDKGLSETMYSLAGSFGTRNDFHLSDGKMVYGPITDNYKEFLTYMRKLYTEGLINTDFAVNQDAFNLILQEKGGFTIGSMSTGVIATHELLKSQNPEYNYVSVPWITGPDGYQSNTVDKNGGSRVTAVTTACKNPEIALAWLDYAYSYAGSLSSTYGIEGKSYTFVDDYPTIMDEVKKNSNGWSDEQSISRWMLGAINYPNARDYRFYEQINLNEDYKKDIQKNWLLAKDDIILPPIVLTPEESTTYSGIMADLTTYVSECSLKFITGQMDLDKDWDQYVSKVKSMKLEQAQACKEAALIRYQNR